MLIPLFISAIAFKLFYILLVLLRSRNELLLREQQSNWVAEVMGVKE
jgi:heme exporter protein C